MSKAVIIPTGVKVRCENWYWSRKLQILLSEVIGCSWGGRIKTPWNTGREFLVIQNYPGGWFFAWATEQDFAQCGLPEWSAKDLIAAYSNPS